MDSPEAPAVATSQANDRAHSHWSEAVTVIVAAMAITAGRCGRDGGAYGCCGPTQIGTWAGRGGSPYGWPGCPVGTGPVGQLPGGPNWGAPCGPGCWAPGGPSRAGPGGPGT
ncbi:hypothetical protein GCM10022204_21530 [Microlunatus aurantiacus]|uniref:Uncharacterized protein n=1 Tax=Microlunatus aurantiacus TaxID=446786 RepID=A0ABP7DGK7_9ACTN